MIRTFAILAIIVIAGCDNSITIHPGRKSDDRGVDRTAYGRDEYVWEKWPEYYVLQTVKHQGLHVLSGSFAATIDGSPSTVADVYQRWTNGERCRVEVDTTTGGYGGQVAAMRFFSH